MSQSKTLDVQKIQLDAYQEQGPIHLGPWTSNLWRTDPRHLGFLLARYKFCAKMLAGKSKVLEVGCGDAFGIPVILQTVQSVHGIDFEPLIIEDARGRLDAEGRHRVSFSVLDITTETLDRKFDAAYSLDVIEHIPHELDDIFMANMCQALLPHGVCILGSPNIEASKHASPGAAESHINLKSAETLHALLARYFHNIFIFSMNDEVVHTGYYPMAHYLLAMGVGVRAEAAV